MFHLALQPDFNKTLKDEQTVRVIQKEFSIKERDGFGVMATAFFDNKVSEHVMLGYESTTTGRYRVNLNDFNSMENKDIKVYSTLRAKDKRKLTSVELLDILDKKFPTFPVTYKHLVVFISPFNTYKIIGFNSKKFIDGAVLFLQLIDLPQDIHIKFLCALGYNPTQAQPINVSNYVRTWTEEEEQLVKNRKFLNI